MLLVAVLVIPYGCLVLTKIHLFIVLIFQQRLRLCHLFGRRQCGQSADERTARVGREEGKSAVIAGYRTVQITNHYPFNPCTPLDRP